jgi:hypothetical protein
MKEHVALEKPQYWRKAVPLISFIANPLFSKVLFSCRFCG